MFVALFSSSTIIQVFQQDNLKADGRNARTLYASFSAERGPILVDGEPIAVVGAGRRRVQVPARSTLNGPLYSAVTGYFTLNQGNTGIEGSLNDYLSGTANEQFLDQLNAIITGQNPKGAAVELDHRPGRAAGGVGRARRPEGRRGRDRPEDRRDPGDGLEADLRPDRARDPRRRRVHAPPTTRCSPTPTTR